MALSDDEQRLLDQMEAALAPRPKLANTLQRHQPTLASTTAFFAESASWWSHLPRGRMDSTLPSACWASSSCSRPPSSVSRPGSRRALVGRPNLTAAETPPNRTSWAGWKIAGAAVRRRPLTWTDRGHTEQGHQRANQVVGGAHHLSIAG